jgi:hypothetical protein
VVILVSTLILVGKCKRTLIWNQNVSALDVCFFSISFKKQILILGTEVLTLLIFID